MTTDKSDIEKRKEMVRARAAAGSANGTVKVAASAPKATPTNDYQAYVKAEKAAGRDPLSKVEWAESLVKASKERTKPKAKDDVAAAADARREKASKEKVEAKKVEEATTTPKPAKKEKVVKDPNALTVSDIAREMGIEPKVARARLRKDGSRAADGRWPTVVRDSQEHKDLIAKLAKVGNEEAVKADVKKAKTEPKTTETSNV